MGERLIILSVGVLLAGAITAGILAAEPMLAARGGKPAPVPVCTYDQYVTGGQICTM